MKLIKENKSILLLALIELVCGILVLVDVIGFTKTILRILGILIAVRGAMFCYDYFKKDPKTASLGNDLFFGIVTIAIGIFFVINPDEIMQTFSLLTTIYGIALFVSSMSKLQVAVNELRFRNSKWWYYALLAAITLIVAIVSYRNPFQSIKSNWTFTGISMIVLALADVATIVFKYVDIKPKPKPVKEEPVINKPEAIEADVTIREVESDTPNVFEEIKVEDIAEEIKPENNVVDIDTVITEPQKDKKDETGV